MDRPSIDRRDFLRATVAGAAWLGCESFAAPMDAAQRRAPAADLLLTNGTFVDGRGAVGRALSVRNGRIVGIGAARTLGPSARTIDLGGRTVVPGLFDAHAHYTRAGVNPGHEARRVERAFSIAELQEVIAKRAVTVPPGAFITCIGGWNHLQLAEGRRPTRMELDAAAPKHGVYLSGTGGGTGAITNSIGSVFFQARGVKVDDSGAVSSGRAAVAALQAVQTAEDRLRGTAELNAHANRVGLTGVINAGNLSDQELALSLWRQGRLTLRMRPVFPADTPQEAEARAVNNFSQGGRAVGDDLFRPAGFGERIGGMDPMSSQFEPTARMIATHGWSLQQHSITRRENDFHLEAFRAVAREHPLDRLRWSILHLQDIDEPRLQALKALGCGASAQTWTYFGTGGGPPFRRIVDSGIRAGVGTDSTNVSALDPWLSLFYMTTGRNVAGALTNAGQQVSRIEALRLYTEGSAWFSFDDHHVGSFEVGKYADLAVLSHDYLTVPEPMIRRIESVLTMVGGQVVHALPPFAGTV